MSKKINKRPAKI